MQPWEQDFWQELKDALALPQVADLKQLCQLFDQAIAQLPENQQLGAAGKAIEQIAAVFASKAEWLMTTWEVDHEASDSSLPVLASEMLDGWIRQSMSIDLDIFLEQPISKRCRREQQHQPTDSIAAVVDQSALLSMLDQMETESTHDQMIRDLAGEENPVKWSATISQWLQEYSPKEPIRLSDLYCKLGMPWVEVLLGLLLGEFILEQRGDFYSVCDIWITLGGKTADGSEIEAKSGYNVKS